MAFRTDKPSDRYDVVVLGSGLAGTAAALAAREHGASVLVAEKAPRESAGGATRFSGGGFRVPSETYSPDDFFDDLMLVTKGRGNKVLLRQMVDRANDDVEWLQGYGLAFGEHSTSPTGAGPRRAPVLHAQAVPFDIDGVSQPGFGNGAVQLLHETLMTKVDFVCDTKAERLLVDDHRRVIGVRTFHREHGYQDVSAGAVVIATGGFQANQEMRSRYFGREAAHWRVRGTRFNIGDGIRMALDAGGAAAGDFTDIHCAVIDARSRAVECGHTNINGYPLSIIVNTNGERFLDEGEDFRDFTYAKFGRSILEQPGCVAYAIFDEQLVDLMSCVVKEWKPVSASTISDLAKQLGIDSVALERTVDAFNSSIDRSVPFSNKGKDGRAAKGIVPEKSNWAAEVENPPFYAYTVTGGVTFTFGGIKTNLKSEVISTEEHPIPGLYAAGELQGDFFYYNYPGGSSLIRASVYGREAGTNAAAHASSVGAPTTRGYGAQGCG